MDPRETACGEIGGLLRELAQKRCSGELGAEAFVVSILRLEEERVRPAGLVLSACDIDDDWTVFNLFIESAGRPCITFEFCPATGEFREAPPDEAGEREPRHSADAPPTAQKPA